MSKTRRLDQLLSSLGYGSRREAQGLVDRGQVTVQGTVAERADLRVHPEDVKVKGEMLEAPNGLFAMLHKPVGYVCTHSEGEGPTVYELLPPRWRQRNPAVTTVGRLDKDTSGLLLITDQGPLVHRLTSSKHQVDKVYEVTVDKPLEDHLVETFRSGTLLLRSETKPCLPASLEITGPVTARVTLTEGRYHQVRRMFASQGWQVEQLHRSRFGTYELGGLEAGSWQLLDLGEH